MPKIIENIRENLLSEARMQVMEQGYATMTIRSVAGACGVGVGTVYNYFPSKDMLVASFMLEDWQACIDEIGKCCEVSMDPQAVLQCVYDELKSFITEYSGLFQDADAGASFAKEFMQRHKLLRAQIAQPLQKICMMQDKVAPELLAEFVAENMLTWTLSDKVFEEIKSILLQLF